MSTINTNGINVNYPVPGVNNNSQGFRDNFAAIKNNLTIAASEITDLQTKAVLKSALDNIALDNDMGNTLISNAVTRGFRQSTYNLGSSLAGQILVDVSLGDVQYGTIVGSTQLEFAGWAPAGTQSNLQLNLVFANTGAVLSFPEEVTILGFNSIGTLENYAEVSNVSTITVPAGITELDFILSTLDCGNTISISPINRPRQSTQVFKRDPAPAGQLGDKTGTISVSASSSTAVAECTGSNSVSDTYTCDSTEGLYLDMPVTFTGNVFGGVSLNTVYYIRSIPTSTTFTLSSTPGSVTGPAAALQLTTSTGTMQVTPTTYLYVAAGDYDGITLTKFATNAGPIITTAVAANTTASGNVITLTSSPTLTLGTPVTFSGSNTQVYLTNTFSTNNYVRVTSTSGMVLNGRIYITGNTFGGINTANYYYISNIDSSNNQIKLSTTYGGGNITVTTASGNASGYYGGVFGNLSANTQYYVTYTSGSTIAVSTVSGGANAALVSENGSMTVNLTTAYELQLNNSSGLELNDSITFVGNIFGGLTEGAVYYINKLSGANISVSITRYNGTAGQTFALSSGTGNMAAVIQQGTSIWRRVQLTSW